MEKLYRPVKIGALELNGNIFLGPMAGYTDRSFRSVCADEGAVMAYTEMVSTEGLVRDGKNTVSLLRKAGNERNVAVQLFGSNPQAFAASAEKLNGSGFCLIDVNCGCPVPKVVKTGAGSALMQNPDLIYSIVKSLADNTDLPVSVKIRMGWDSGCVNFQEAADAARSAGAAAICLHARTRAQFYSGTADYSAIAELKKHTDIPVIGSGDVFGPEDAKRMLETGCDALIFARGAIGRAYVFRQTRQYLETGKYEEVSLERRAELLLRQLDLLSADIGENKASREMRKSMPYFLKGVKNSAPVKQRMSQAESRRDYVEAFALLLDCFKA